MTESNVVPELRHILGAMIFAAHRPVGIKEMRACLRDVAASQGRETKAFAEVKPSDIARELEALKADMTAHPRGFLLKEVAGGYRFESDPRCGKWLRHLLNRGKTNRLSQPALETLAIIAYRQPTTRTEVERIRGVNVDHIVRMLMEMQLVRIAGRSDLPGRPFLYGTTQSFLEHFGLKSLSDLRDMDSLGLRAELNRREQATEAAPQEGEVEDEDEAGDEEAAEEAAAGGSENESGGTERTD